MTGIARETLVFRRGGFSPPLSLLIPTFAFPDAPAEVAPRIQGGPECSPTDTPPIREAYPAPSVSALYPIIIHARTLD